MLPALILQVAPTSDTLPHLPPSHLAVECVVVVFSAEQEQRIVQDVKLLLLGLHSEGEMGGGLCE